MTNKYLVNCINSLQEIDGLIHYSKSEDYEDEINLIINRILLEEESKSRVEQCIYHIEVWSGE